MNLLQHGDFYGLIIQWPSFRFWLVSWLLLLESIIGILTGKQINLYSYVFYGSCIKFDDKVAYWFHWVKLLDNLISILTIGSINPFIRVLLTRKDWI